MKTVKAFESRTDQQNHNEEFSDAYIQMMWLLFLRCPGVDAQDDSGAYYLGEIGETRNKNWTRMTPYSPAETR